MPRITYISPTPTKHEIPSIFPSPFNNEPHPLAKKASLQLQETLNTQGDWTHDFNATDGGKMFGVLVVRDNKQRIGFLSAFSGMLAGQWLLPRFVPPIFNQTMQSNFLPNGENQLKIYTEQIQALTNNSNIEKLERQLMQQTLQRDIQLQTLRQTHINRKSQRQLQRNNDIHKSTEEFDQLLLKLSHESQQDKKEKKSLIAYWQLRLDATQLELDSIKKNLQKLKETRSKLSTQLHEKVFSTYTLNNTIGEEISIRELFSESMPPGGTGDCAAPKLMHYANKHNLKPLAMAEFWWGAPPASGIRHHGHYYPACRGKCHPILPFMLKGMTVEKQEDFGNNCNDPNAPNVVYEDGNLLVVNKPHGLLSVPGKTVQDSVLNRIKTRYPDATGPLLVHRLDLDTSGLLLIAKNSATHKALQQQFIQHNIEKRYVAILSKKIPTTISNQGIIELPLRVDLNDRPRQVVCFKYGKPAKTHWKIITRGQNCTRLYLFPITGRTHQLRVHAAHASGLNAPIVGDNLYGMTSDRLYLHAEYLSFTHPITKRRIDLETPAPF